MAMRLYRIVVFGETHGNASLQDHPVLEFESPKIESVNYLADFSILGTEQNIFFYLCNLNNKNH